MSFVSPSDPTVSINRLIFVLFENLNPLFADGRYFVHTFLHSASAQGNGHNS